MENLDGQRIVVTGGTGSLGKCLVRRLLAGEMGKPARVVVFSRDEAKQHEMRLESHGWAAATDEVIYGDLKERLQFVVGDVRDCQAVYGVLQGAHVVIHAAAMKQVPTCEYNPSEAIQTNVMGAAWIVRALRDNCFRPHTVVGISTDKAVKPVNVYGMTKAIQERLFLKANLQVPNTRFVSVRYGNVLASRGSVVPLFWSQIRSGGPVTVTDPKMTRFFFTIDQAVDTVFEALKYAEPGETLVPKIPSVRMIDLAMAMIGKHPITIQHTGIRPGEKLHEVLVSEEERTRTVTRGGYYVVRPILPELRPLDEPPIGILREYTSSENTLSEAAVWQLLADADLLEDKACE